MNRTPQRSLAASLVAVIAAGLLVTPSSAAWVDAEFDHARLGVIDCETTELYTSTASGTFLGADLLGIPLETVAELENVAVTVAPGQPDQVSPPGATALGDHAYANPLTVSALNAALAADLSGLLYLPLDTGSGVLNQYARADTSGSSTGASGAVLNSGAINLEPTVSGPDAPSIATLSLGNVVASALGPGGAALIGEVAGLDLRWGAVAGLASIEQCMADYTGSLLGSLAREYLIASLDLDIASPLVGDLTGAVSTAVADLEAQLGNLTGSNSSLLAGITSGLTALLDGVLGVLSLGTVSIALSADWDFSAVQDLLDDTISDSAGIVEIDLATGVVAVDIAALVDPVNGLNGMAPNSEILIDAAMIEQLEDAVTEALGEWVGQVDAALTAALSAITIDGAVSVRIRGLGIDLVSVTLTLSDASLAQLVTNSVPAPAAVVTVQVLGACLLICGLLDTVLGVLISGFQGVVGTAVTALLTPITSGLGSTLDVLTDSVTSPLVQLVALLTEGLLGVDGVASLLVNVQNDPLSGGPEPGDWAGIPIGRYDVAALRLGVLGLLGPGQDVDLVLARGSVGPNGIP